MPLYDYKCKQCGHVFDEYVHLANKAVSCPKCGASDAIKQPPTCFPAILGSPSGPGGVRARETCFDRVDTKKEMKETFSKMEEMGKFRNNPQLARNCETIWNDIKDKPMTTHDYQVDGV